MDFEKKNKQTNSELKVQQINESKRSTIIASQHRTSVRVEDKCFLPFILSCVYTLIKSQDVINVCNLAVCYEQTTKPTLWISENTHINAQMHTYSLHVRPLEVLIVERKAHLNIHHLTTHTQIHTYHL